MLYFFEKLWLHVKLVIYLMNTMFWIIVLNSLHNKYAECNKDFNPPQAKDFYKNWEEFYAFYDAILDINNIS